VLRAFSTMMLSALASTSLPVRSSIVRVISDRILPKDDALVTSRVTPPAVIVHRYSACVCAETMTLIERSSRLAISAIGLPARLPAHPFRSALPAWKPPSWITRTFVFTSRSSLSSCTAALAASASSWNVRPATPVGVTIVGVASRTSPMKPTSIVRPLSDKNSLTPKAGSSVSPVAFTTTFADRYWKSAPGNVLVVEPSESA